MTAGQGREAAQTQLQRGTSSKRAAAGGTSGGQGGEAGRGKCRTPLGGRAGGAKSGVPSRAKFWREEARHRQSLQF